MRPFSQAAHPAVRACAAARHACHIEASAKASPLARKHDRAHARHFRKLRTGGNNPLKHRRIKCIHLVHTVQPDISDMVVDGNGYAVVHTWLLFRANSTSGN